MAGKKHAKRQPPALRNTALTDALQVQDVAAVAFALRHGPTVVPLAPNGEADAIGADGVWIHRDPDSGEVALLLFSDAAHKPKTIPPDVKLESPAWLRAFLEAHQGEIATVFLDAAGPHPMRATPADLIAALDA